MRAKTSAALPLDLDGFPTVWFVPFARWSRWAGAVVAAGGVFRVVVELLGPLTGTGLAVGVVQALAGVAMATGFASARVRLEREGYRVGDGIYRGRLRSWSDVREVREAGPGTRHPEIRAGGSAADAAPVRLAGMSADQVVDLRRRIDEARARERATRS